MKFSADPEAIKVLYEKEGKLYIRAGQDGFETGKAANAPLKSIINKWGFRTVENPPEFRDAEELLDGLPNFELKSDGKISYSKPF
ncbi:hypothetical protein D3C73_1470310 [compost metagenome]